MAYLRVHCCNLYSQLCRKFFQTFYSKKLGNFLVIADFQQK